MLTTKWKKLHPDAVVPKYARQGDAGADLVATSKEYRREYGFYVDQIIYGFGLAIVIPDGHVGLLFPRSSIYKTELTLANSVGVIDSKYRGEIKAVFNVDAAHGEDGPVEYDVGDRVAQLVIIPIPDVQFEEVDELDDTDRGDGSFGHTGR